MHYELIISLDIVTIQSYCKIDFPMLYAISLLFISGSQFSSVAQSCPTFCDHMAVACPPGFPVHHLSVYILST